MKLFRPKKKTETTITRTEALSCVPAYCTSASWEQLASGLIIIEYPLNLKPFFIELARKFNKRPQQRLTKKLELDAMGTKVWLMIDGKKDVKSIIKEVSGASGMSLHESEISVTTFFRQLGRRGILNLGQPN